jgi:hypothetical protein
MGKGRMARLPNVREGTWIFAGQPGDYKNAAQFCKAERDFLGDAAFTHKYGGGANAHGKCVSQNH